MVCKPRIEDSMLCDGVEYNSSDKNTCLNLNKLILFAYRGKISAQPYTIVKQICFPDGNVLFLSLFSLSRN